MSGSRQNADVTPKGTSHPGHTQWLSSPSAGQGRLHLAKLYGSDLSHEHDTRFADFCCFKYDGPTGSK